MKSLCAASLTRALGPLLCFPLWAAWAPLGPFGGSASFVAADPHSSKTFLAGTRNALLFRTDDAGESWTAIWFPAQLQATLNALAIDPQTPGIYLAGLSSELPQYSGLLRSTDAGATWGQVADLRNQRVRAIAFKRANSQIIAVGTDAGVFASPDGGSTWSRVSPLDNAQLRPVVSLAFDPNDSATLYAGTPHLPWKTADGGVSWHSIDTGMLDDSDVFSIQVDRNRPQRVFVSACSGIYRSLNAAATWTRLIEAKDASYRTYVVVQDPQHENVWFAGTTHGMVRSVDGGANWVKLGPFATRAIAFDPRRLGRILIATEEAGILRSDDDGATWNPANKGFCNRRLSSFWTAAGTVYAAAVDGLSGGSVLKLAEDLSEWTTVAVTSRIKSVPSDVVSPPWSPHLVMAKTESGLFISEDTGRHWNPLDLPESASRIWAFAALDNPWIAAVGAAGILLSRDGKSWRPCSLAVGEVYGVASTHEGGLLAATNSGLKASDNLGGSWYPVRGDLETGAIQAICRHPRRTALLFAARYGVIYASTDAGRSWRRISAEAWPISSVKQLTVVPGTPDRLLVLTHQQGIWEWPFDTGPPPGSAGH
jgi:photosystem II stability/assembly factor-like uncharacterized protein